MVKINTRSSNKASGKESRQGAQGSTYWSKEKKVQQQQEKRLVSSEQTQLTISSFQAGVPKIEDVRTTSWDVLATANNGFLAVIQAELKRLQQEDPTFFNSGNISPSGMSMTNLAYYFAFIVVSYLREVKAISGPGAADSNLIEPDKNAPVPHCLAKLLEYCAPYVDQNTGAVYQPRYNCSAWPTFTTSNTDNMTASQSNLMLKTEGSTRNAYPADATMTILSLTQALSSNINLLTVMQNLDCFYAALSSQAGYCRYGDIARRAPDASANTYISSRNTSAIICPVEHFDPDVAFLFRVFGYKQGWAYSKNFNCGMDVNDDNNGTYDGNLFNGLANLDMWAFMMASCETYLPGKYTRMLQTSIYAGGKGLRSYIVNMFTMNASGLKQLIAGIMYEWDQEGIAFDAAAQGISNFYAVSVLQVIARVGRYAQLSGYWSSANKDLVMYAPDALKILNHPLVAEYITSLGPVNIDGVMYFPWLNYDKNNLGSWLLAYYTYNGALSQAGGSAFYKPAIPTNVAVPTTLGGLNISAIVSTTSFWGASDAQIALIDPVWMNVNPLNLVPQDMWMPPKDQVFGDISMFCQWNVRGQFAFIPKNANNVTVKATFLLHSVVQQNNIVPLTVNQNDRALKRSISSNVQPLDGTLVFTNVYQFYVNANNAGLNAFSCSQRMEVAEKPLLSAQVARYLDTPDSRQAYGVAKGEELIKGRRYEPIQIVEKMVGEVTRSEAGDRYNLGEPSIVPLWLKSGFSSLYNSIPGQKFVAGVKKHGLPIASKLVASALGGGYGSVAEGIMSIIANSNIPRKLLGEALPSVVIEEVPEY